MVILDGVVNVRQVVMVGVTKMVKPRKAGVKYLLTTTPVLDGRSFGTNMMEAALVAVSGKNRPLTWDELSEMIAKLGFEPQLQELN